MSWVTNVLLSVDVFEDMLLVEEFSEWLRTAAPRREPPGATGVGFLARLSDPDQHQWGGWKNPEVHLFGGALNHGDVSSVIDKFATMPWRVPEFAQLMVMDQEQAVFRVWMLRDGGAVQVVPVADFLADD